MIPGLVPPIWVLLVTPIDIPQNVFAYWTTQTDCLSNLIVLIFIRKLLYIIRNSFTGTVKSIPIDCAMRCIANTKTERLAIACGHILDYINLLPVEFNYVEFYSYIIKNSCYDLHNKLSEICKAWNCLWSHRRTTQTCCLSYE